ncbi:MAG: translation elongation factor Ts [Candidatus Marinimicrobia bacterium]|nr:translation elongation factor Ts [Candidatus Neomarinimicrobiota bacterium]
MEISAKQVKELRDRTGIGMMECKKALSESDGDIEKAIELLRKKGMAKAAKKSGRDVNEGVIQAYIHQGNKIGVLIEVNCETDFVSNNSDFKNFVNDVCMQIAASNPMAIDRDGIPEEVLEKEKEIFRAQGANEGKPAEIVEKIMVGRIEKFYAQSCLLEQEFVKETSKTIKEYLNETIMKIGENISIKRFTRYELGE